MSGLGGWVLMLDADVHGTWRERAVSVLLVPLLRGEAEQVFAGEPVRPELTSAEASLLGVLVNGSTIKEAAAELGLHLRTVERRLAALRRRTGVDTTAELVRHFAGAAS